ncbi:MAG: hypothetical protein IPK81_20955 [Rhodospirillales bacterium]|nr:MAG: hypothetical protein IPK81_20955 [Rhodospirillales bacterium]
MNTSVHWRAYATNLLSREFLEIARGHLNPGGMITYNGSGSDDAFKTAASVFPHARRYENFILGWMAPPDLPPALIEKRLWAMTLDGKPILDPAAEADRRVVAGIANRKLVTIAEVEAASRRKLEIVTDRNMVTEFRHGSAISGAAPH